MAVRFLPAPEDRSREPREDRPDFAEVIEFRSRLTRPSDADADADGVESHASLGRDRRDAANAEQVQSAPLVALRAAVERKVADGVAWRGDDDDDDENGSATDSSDSVDAVAACTEAGVLLLARRARSSGELREELSRLDHAADAVEIVIDEFERSHYLDDAGLARSVSEKLRETKKASRSQIRVKLRARKLPDDVIEEALGQLDTDEEFTLLQEAAESRARKLDGLDRQTAERRLLGFLARRGWSGEPAMRAARSALDGVASPHSSSGVRFR